MAIQINGNGTITGISVGGLPDGIVDTDMIAASAVTPAKSTITGGKVLQTLHMTTTTDVHIDNSTAWFDTNLEQSITMTSASNKVLILSNLYVYLYGNGDVGCAMRLLRGSTDTGVINGYAIQLATSGGAADAQQICPMHHLDSPGAGTHTYKIQCKALATDDDIYVNGGGDMDSTLTLLEIAA